MGAVDSRPRGNAPDAAVAYFENGRHPAVQERPIAFVGFGLCIGFDIQTPEWLKEWPSIKVYGIVFCAFVAWGTGYFAFRRLIMYPHPPEFLKKTEKQAD